jgi:hypothetical protein
VQKNIRKPPHGEINNVHQSEDDPSRIFLDMKCGETGEKRKEEYSRDFLAAALMLYCRGLGIPLPKTASKSVLIRDGEVALRVKI